MALIIKYLQNTVKGYAPVLYILGHNAYNTTEKIEETLIYTYLLYNCLLPKISKGMQLFSSMIVGDNKCNNCERFLLLKYSQDIDISI